MFICSLIILKKENFFVFLLLFSSLKMKPGSVVADEMFPEGAGPYMDLDEVNEKF